MMDVGIHMTDLARYILGDVTEVYGVSSNHIWKVPGFGGQCGSRVPQPIRYSGDL